MMRGSGRTPRPDRGSGKEPAEGLNRSQAIARSWDRNAARWTRAVRAGLIGSRKAGTDDAIVKAIVRRNPQRLLDMGCGEGWLIRRLVRLTGCEAVGIDGSLELIEQARLADPTSCYLHLAYDDLLRRPRVLEKTFDVIVFNFALFDEAASIVLAGVKPLLAGNGVVILQTLHPGSLPQERATRDGWRIEDFSAFEEEHWEPMPWFFRTLESWRQVMRGAGLALQDLTEPTAEEGGPPLSLLMTCGLAKP